MKDKEICNMLHRFLDEFEPMSDEQLNIIADHFDDCKECKLQAAGFIVAMGGEL